jgi:hypothetical protein
MFKKRIACGLLVLVTLCLATVNAPSQKDTQKAGSAPAAPGGVPGPDRLLKAPAPPPDDEQPNLRQLVTRLTEIRRQRDALDKEEARLVAKIRAAVATQRADLDRVEQLLREHEQGKGRAPGKFPAEKKTTTEDPFGKGQLLDKRP